MKTIEQLIQYLQRWVDEKRSKGARINRDTVEVLHEFYKCNPSEIPNSSPIPPLHPGSWTFPLFHHIISEHDKILTDSECMEIVEIVRRMDAASPASPWISVEDRLPVVGIRYNFINDITHSPYYGEVFGGKYMGCRFGYHEFGLPGHSMTAKLYCPIPAPPESLTQKLQ